MSTAETLLARAETEVEYSVETEVVDRAGAHQVLGCDPDGDGDGRTDEDDCLFECLIRRFVNEFGCVHPRCAISIRLLIPRILKSVSGCRLTFFPQYRRDPALSSTRKCLHGDLQEKTAQMREDMLRNAQKFGLEYGQLKLKND